MGTDIISRVIGKSTLQDDEKYDSDDSHPSNLSVSNVFNPSEDIVLNIFTDIISTVIGKSTLPDDEKYVSDDSHPSNLSVPNVFNPSEDISHLSAVSTVSTEGNRFQKDENFNILNKSSVIESEPFVQDSYSKNSEDDLLTNISTVLQG